MEAAPCPKCKTPVDKDRMSWTGNNSAGYASNKQTGMLRDTLSEDGSLTPHKVQIGITDGTRTEIHGEGIEAGMQVVIGINLVGSAGGASGAASNPFQQQQPQGRGPRGLF